MSPPEEHPQHESAPVLASALGESVNRLEWQGKEIFVVGTAHVSKKSAEEVVALIEELRPDSVCIELDLGRYEMLKDETRWRRLDVRAVLRDGRAGLMLASLLFSGFQNRLGKKLGVRPGSEMLAAASAADRIGAKIVLADRDVQATLRRCYESLGALDRAKIFVALAFLPFAAADIEEADVERLKGREAIGDAMSVFAQQMPALKVPLIDERDQYLIASTREAAGRRIVSVVGAAHVAGMVRNVDAVIDRATLSAFPPPSSGSRFRPWILPILIAALGALTFGRGGTLHSLGLLGARTLVLSGLASFVGVLVAGGSLGAAMAAFSVAPLTLMVPVVPLERIVGEVQAVARPPGGDDGAAVREDLLTPSRLRKNRFIVVLLVTVSAQLGRTVGAVAGLLWAAVHLL